MCSNLRAMRLPAATGIVELSSENRCTRLQPEQNTTTRLEIAALDLNVLSCGVCVAEAALQRTGFVNRRSAANIVGNPHDRLCDICDLGARQPDLGPLLQ